MKKFATLLFSIFAALILSACANKSGPDMNPTLRANSAPTSRLPSPGNYQRNVQLNASTMQAPSRP